MTNEPDYQVKDAAEDDKAASRLKSKTRTIEQAEKRIAGVLIQVMPKRDLVVFEWLCHATGKKPGKIALEMIRAATIKERPAYREAMGQGGGSSQNLETLSERLPVHKVKN